MYLTRKDGVNYDMYPDTLDNASCCQEGKDEEGEEEEEEEEESHRIGQIKAGYIISPGKTVSPSRSSRPERDHAAERGQRVPVSAP